MSALIEIMNHSFQRDFESAAEAKRHAILSTALSVFTTYGFSKVTMDDIAKAVGISRPALYQFFRNKHEIFHGGLEDWCQTALHIMRREAEKDLSCKERLFNVIKFGIFDEMARIDQTAHGKELLELKNAISKDVMSDFMNDVQAILKCLFSEAMALAQQKTFEADTLAANFLFWMEGMKVQVEDPKQREALLRNYIDVQLAAINAA